MYFILYMHEEKNLRNEQNERNERSRKKICKNNKHTNVCWLQQNLFTLKEKKNKKKKHKR